MTASTHHHRQRRWTWAHVQQGLRRNCFIGPVAFCLVVVLIAPHVVHEEHLIVQQLPLVEAVPFFRRAIASRKRRRRAATVAVTSVPVVTAAAVATTLEEVVSVVEGGVSFPSATSTDMSNVTVLQQDEENLMIAHRHVPRGMPFVGRPRIAFRKRRQRRQQQRALPVLLQVSGGAASMTAIAEPVAMTVEEEEVLSAVTTQEEEVVEDATSSSSDAPPTEEAKSSSTSTSATATVEAPATPTATTTSAGSKRKHSEISPSTSSHDYPLFVGQDDFEKDPSAPIPFRYYEAHQRKEDVARKAVLTSLQWRKEHQIDTILERPHPNFDIAKRILPHYFIGRSSVSNHVVFVQRPGLADLPLARHNGLELQDMLDEYAYVFEYCWNVLHTNQQTTMEGDKDLMIGIMDLQGLNLGILRKSDLINFVKEFVGMIDAHYPTRAYKTIMVNAPGWFSTLYKLISPIMRETTKEKIVLFSAGKAQDDALEAALGKEMAKTLSQALRIPDKKERKAKAKDDLSLTSDILLETDMEQEMRQFVMQRLEADGLEMKKIVPM